MPCGSTQYPFASNSTLPSGPSYSTQFRGRALLRSHRSQRWQPPAQQATALPEGS
jgi:hypothetical protein